MTRKKVQLAFITNDSARKATYKKRKKGLMKKVSELSTLCGIEACAIIYSPYESQPEVWPNDLGVQNVIAQFKRMPEMEQSKKMVNQESFTRQRIAKATELLNKQHKENREKQMTEVMYQCLTGRSMQNLSLTDLNDVRWLADQRLKEVYKMRESLANNQQVVQPPQLPPPPPPPQPAVAASSNEMMPIGVQGQGQAVQNPGMDLSLEAMQRQEWFTEWMNNPGEAMGFGHGEEMMMPFHENHQNTTWSNAFFP